MSVERPIDVSSGGKEKSAWAILARFLASASRHYVCRTRLWAFDLVSSSPEKLKRNALDYQIGDFSSAFVAGVTIAATWDRQLIYQRGVDMGTEHRLKGVDVQLGPVVGPLGRNPTGGRNWEGMCD